MNFSVGQVIYLLTRKNPKVYPVLICEEIQKKSLNGKTVSYVVRLPTGEGNEIDLDKIDAEIFETLEKTRSYIVERAEAQIDQMLDDAKKISEIFSQFVINSEDINSIAEEAVTDEEEYATVDLGDGSIARINVSDINKISGD